MLTFFRRVSKSKVGTWIMATVLIAILAGFAVADISNFGSGNVGGFGGMSSSTLAKVGDQEVSEREMSEQCSGICSRSGAKSECRLRDDPRRLRSVLSSMLDERALIAFGNKYGFKLSKRLIDAEIAELPQAKGLNGQFSEQAYQQFLARQRLTDPQVREIIAGGLLQRLMLTPVAANARISVGMATALRIHDARIARGRGGRPAPRSVQGGSESDRCTTAAILCGQPQPLHDPRTAGPPHRDARPEQVANVTPSPQEIAAYYKSNQATYGSKETRGLSQVVVPDQATANGIAARAKGGQTLAAAAAPAGSNAAVTSLADQTRQGYSSVAGDKVAAAVFSAPTGPSWGRSVRFRLGCGQDRPRSRARRQDPCRGAPEIAAKLTGDKRKGAIEIRRQDPGCDRRGRQLHRGSRGCEASRYDNAADLRQRSSRPTRNLAGGRISPPASRPASRSQPMIRRKSSRCRRHGLRPGVSGASIPAAPAPSPASGPNCRRLAERSGFERARAAATAIAAKASQGVSLVDAVKQAGVPLPAVQPIAARRIQLATANGQVPPAMRLLFTLGQGKSGPAPDPGPWLLRGEGRQDRSRHCDACSEL